MASNVIQMKPKHKTTPLQRIAQTLALRKLQSLARLKRGDQQRLAADRAPEVVYGERGRYETTNTRMAKLLARKDKV